MKHIKAALRYLEYLAMEVIGYVMFFIVTGSHREAKAMLLPTLSISDFYNESTKETPQ